MNSLKQSLDHFEGSLLGGLIGDALGRNFEFIPYTEHNKKIVQYFLDGLEQREDAEFHKYSDDSVMTMAFSQVLVEDGVKIDPVRLAKRFAEDYFREPNRGYGGNVISVFASLQQRNYADPYGPGMETFGGKGSLGNGAGMRISPLGLLTSFNTNLETLVKIAWDSSRITHSHPEGICGAIFQAVAVRWAFKIGIEMNYSVQATNSVQIRETIFERVYSDLVAAIEIEPSIVRLGMVPYLKKLDQINEFLKQGNNNVTPENIRKSLGVDVTGLDSIPTAFYCFLASFEEIPDVVAKNSFRRCIQFAMTLGGDTDTIASMAGSISGAFYGKQIISCENLARHCEGVDLILQVANQLHAVYINLCNAQEKSDKSLA